MKLTICLAKTVLIFYSILAPLIIIGSLFNLVEGVVLNQNRYIYIGAFSLFGFILLPILLVRTYRQNKCVIQANKLSIGNADFLSSDYSFYIYEKYLPLKDRPIVFLLRKTYYIFVVKERRTDKVVLEKDLNVFQRDIRDIRSVLLNNFK